MSQVKRVLVPTDFGLSSDDPVAYGCQLAEQFHAELHLLHVVPEGLLTAPFNDVTDRLHAARQELGKFPASLSPNSPKIVRAVCAGKPAEEILRYAGEQAIGTIVMGTRGRSGLSHILLGSVAEKVIRQAPCPVVIVPSGGMGMAESATDQETSDSSRVAGRAPSLGQIPESNRVLELLHRAQGLRATDVHIDPISDDEFRVRFRIDGRLEKYCILDRSVAVPLLMQLKVMSHLDIAQPFEPNEGRVRLPESMSDVEVRITTIPACGGDAVALRLLKHEGTPPSLNELGFLPHSLRAVDDMLHTGEGLVLVTGPTGSGKTTTVHAMLRMLDSGERNIVSIEDPVEYRVPSIRQMSVDLRHGVSDDTRFADAAAHGP